MLGLLKKMIDYRDPKPPVQQEEKKSTPLSASLEENCNEIRHHLHQSGDLQFHSFQLPGQRNAAMVFLSNFVDMKLLHESVLQPIMYRPPEPYATLQDLQQSTLTLLQTSLLDEIELVIQALLNQSAVLLVDGEARALRLLAPPPLTRQINEPVLESAVRGPREGFVENIWVNVGLIRKRMMNPHLQIEDIPSHSQVGSKLFLVYLEGTVPKQLVKEVRKRLEVVQQASWTEFGQVLRLLEGKNFSMFPKVKFTERPDTVTMNLSIGKLAVLLEGNPIVLVFPMSFWGFFEGVDDYNNRTFFAISIYGLRILSYLTSLFLPGLYVALENYQKELIPTSLLVGFIQAREGVPFPLAVEVGFLLVVFEFLREAGIRMPKPIGQAVSIVGALVIGEAAVNAGLIGAPTVIVVALTGVTAFIIDPLNETVAVYRLILVLIAGTFGLYGVLCFFVMKFYYLIASESFGVPYMHPVIPLHKPDILRALARYFPQIKQEAEAELAKERKK